MRIVHPFFFFGVISNCHLNAEREQTLTCQLSQLIIPFITFSAFLLTNSVRSTFPCSSLGISSLSSSTFPFPFPFPFPFSPFSFFPFSIFSPSPSLIMSSLSLFPPNNNDLFSSPTHAFSLPCESLSSAAAPRAARAARANRPQFLYFE